MQRRPAVRPFRRHRAGTASNGWSAACAHVETVFVAAISLLTNGVISLPQSRAGFLLCAVFLGWGGLSVQMQTAAVLADTDLSLRCFRRGKLLQAALSLPLAYLVSLRLF